MVNEKTALVVLGVLAVVGIGAAYVLGYVVGASAFAGYGMMGSWFGQRTQTGNIGPGMMGPGMMNPGAGPGQGWGNGMMGPGMMGPGMMGPGMMSPGARQNTIVITNYAFYPETLVVKRGTSVTWVNMDPVPHTVDSGTHEKHTGVFSSGLLGRMESYSFTFNEAGTYVFHCDPHPYMTGKVIVEG